MDMHKEVVIAVVILLILGIFVAIYQGPQITSATVAGQTKCVGARAALKFINEKGCERIYEDSKCEEQGLVEVRC